MLVVGRVSHYLAAAAEVRVGAHKTRPVGDHLKLSQVGRYPFGTSGSSYPTHIVILIQEKLLI